MADQIKLDQLDRIEAGQVRIEGKLDVLLADTPTPVPNPPTEPGPPPAPEPDDGNNPPEPPDHEDPGTPEPGPGPAPQPNPTPPPGGGDGAAETTRSVADALPALATWTITTTTGKQGSPDNLYPAKLGGGKGYIPGVCYVRRDGGVMFRARVDGVTTKNSKRCRVEARQMAGAPGSWTKAAWDGARPHKLTAVLSGSTEHQTTRKSLSHLQIHDGADDVLQVRQHDGKLCVFTDDGKTITVLDDAYTDHQRYTCTIETGVGGREVEVSYVSGSKTWQARFPTAGRGWYYKAGAYLQESMSEHGAPATDYGEVVIYRLDVTGDPLV